MINSVSKDNRLKAFNVFFLCSIRDFLSVDIDISGLEVNQCDVDTSDDEKKLDNQIESFRGSHKCHDDTTQVNTTEFNKNTS